MASFVLVHGAFHGAWCWVKLIPELNKRGHRVIAPDMPAAGSDRTPLADATMANGVRRITDAIVQAGEPVILVGHSLAGMVISAVAEQWPEGVRRLVYLAALIPHDGDSLHSLMAGMEDPDRPATAQPAIHDPWEGAAQSPPLAEVPDRFYNDCAQADIDYAMARLKPQPNEPRLVTMHLTPERFGRVPKTFIVCEQDNAMPPYRRRLNIATGAFEQVLSLPTGHSPFFSAPEKLADMLSDLAPK